MDFVGKEFKINGNHAWHEGNFNPSTKAESNHTHTKSQISDFPVSLPANGGNSDTVDGKHASDFALSTHVHDASDINSGTISISRLPFSSSTTSNSTSYLATSKAVKTAMDRANEAFQSASDGKNLIATAITGKGVNASGSETFQSLADKIGSISSGAGFTSGDTIIYEDNIAKETTNNSYTKLKEFTVGADGEFKVSFTLQNRRIKLGTSYAYAMIRVNGIFYGAAKIITISNRSETFTETISLKTGDLVEFLAYSSGDATAAAITNVSVGIDTGYIIS